MALKKDITTRQSIEIKDAYFRVVNLTLNGKSGMQFVVAFGKNAQSPAIDSTSHDCNYDIQGDNPIRQAYKHAKNLPEFAGAIDC